MTPREALEIGIRCCLEMVELYRWHVDREEERQAAEILKEVLDNLPKVAEQREYEKQVSFHQGIAEGRRNPQGIILIDNE